MRAAPLLTVIGLVEAATGLLLLVWPALVLALLFDWRQPSVETLVMGRLAGAGTLSLGVVCGVARRGTGAAAQLGVLAGALTYNVVGTVVLVFTGAALGMAGVGLWPAVAYHSVLTAWCAACLRGQRVSLVRAT